MSNSEELTRILQSNVTALRVQVALRLLREALATAAALNRESWDFAIELDQLHSVGLSNTEIRVLLCGQFALHAYEERDTAGNVRTFRPIQNLSLPCEAAFVLTEKGLRLLEQMDETVRNYVSVATPPNLRPRWDRVHRQLFWGGRLVKRFRVPAPNQENIISVFEEDGWPDAIDDPLPQAPDIDPKTRLHDAIKNLNKQIHRLLSFRGDGSGQRILWALYDCSAAGQRVDRYAADRTVADGTEVAERTNQQK